MALVEAEIGPRWVVWSQETAAALVAGGVRPAAAWDVAAVQRLLDGGWRAEPERVWAALHGLDVRDLPRSGPPDLFSLGEQPDDDPDGPLRRDGHLSADWTGGGWARSPERLAAWAGLAARAAVTQAEHLDGARAAATARAESATELLCAELAADGLPLDRAVAEDLLGLVVGARPDSPAAADAQRQRRDADVLRHSPYGEGLDLRSPGQVRSLLRTIGIEVPDTRSWRLEPLRGSHPLVDALLAWRKAERMATTYGYAWLDEHVGPDGRLRGSWSASDGAAGRMTASAGLHNLPAEMRPAVVAEPGHVFVRADLGQIEPRVLAVVSGDPALARATAEDDLYQPVARRLGVERAVAKVAVLGAMYGQTTGRGAEALVGLRAAYPVAMAHLDAADREGQAGRDLRTHGGRLIRLGAGAEDDADLRDARRRSAARGRYARNAVVQGAAAELFKVWAVTVRARARPLDARIVLCLHDELLVHVPAHRAADAVHLLHDGLQEAAYRWDPDGLARFVADIGVVSRWSDAKP